MVDLRKTKPSKNVEDRTNISPLKDKMNNLLLSVNPVLAVRKVRSKLIENGTIAPPRRKIRYKD